VATTAIVARSAGRHALAPLELWHLLSLDAPSVAALWTIFLADAVHAPLPWTAPLALALAVWIFYVADRLGDARGPSCSLEERHRFHARHRRGFRIAIGCAVPVLAALVIALPTEIRTAWLLLVLPLCGYAAAVHWLKLRVPKEMMVGLFFAAAVAAPCILQDPSPAQGIAAIAFGVLCWLNCAGIARAERAETSHVTAWIVRNFRSATLVWTTTAFVLAILLEPARDALLAVACAAALLHLLDRLGSHVSPLRMRALADAALLTPVLLWPLLPHIR
jgi:hypothetical protein